VFDEAHKILTDNMFRRQFQDVKTLAAFKVAKIYLTATLPPIMIPDFLEETGLPTSTRVIRPTTTSRPNLHYMCITIKVPGGPEEVVPSLVSILETRFEKGSRGIIFAPTISNCVALAKHFGGIMSHSQMPPAERAANELSWMEKDAKWIVATTCFMQGIDHPDVRAVLFYDMPYGLFNIEQGSGRAGRSGQPAHILIVNNSQVTWISDGESTCQQMRTEGLRFMRSVSCRRQIMTQVMDGHGMACSQIPGALLCDCCNPKDELFSKLKMEGERLSSQDEFGYAGGWNDQELMDIDPAILAGHQVSRTTLPPLDPQLANLRLPTTANPSMSVAMDHAQHEQRLARRSSKAQVIAALADKTANCCLICDLVFNKPGIPRHHPFSQCYLANYQSPTAVSAGWMRLKKSMKITSAYTYCYRCGLPQGADKPRCHPEVRKGMVCPVDDMVALMVWYIVIDPDLSAKARKVFPDMPKTRAPEEWGAWATKGETVENFYNGLEMACWLAKRIS
jgi:hypothetical protein